MENGKPVLFDELRFHNKSNMKEREKMAKLYFRYGTMGSSKTANALMTKHNFMEKEKKVILVKPDIENRDGTAKIRSRSGLESGCTLWSEFLAVYISGDIKEYDAVIIDEAQFLSGTDVEILADIVDRDSIPVLCYGLRTDFTSHFFEGSKRLMELADVIEELKTVCWCGKRASMNARFDENGIIVKKGEQILMGGNDRYVALCRKHYKEGRLH